MSLEMQTVVPGARDESIRTRVRGGFMYECSRHTATASGRARRRAAITFCSEPSEIAWLRFRRGNAFVELAAQLARHERLGLVEQQVVDVELLLARDIEVFLEARVVTRAVTRPCAR